MIFYVYVYLKSAYLDGARKCNAFHAICKVFIANKEKKCVWQAKCAKNLHFTKKIILPFFTI